jgi:hypothetical protein
MAPVDNYYLYLAMEGVTGLIIWEVVFEVEFRVQDGYWGVPWWVMYGLGK